MMHITLNSADGRVLIMCKEISESLGNECWYTDQLRCIIHLFL